MPKGYPKSRFEIIDQTHIQEITTEVVSNPVAVIMATYTSDKGSEDWELMYGLTEFTKAKGGISFAKHGQPQLLVAEVLRNGGYVFGKRLVSSNATLANVTIRARVVEADGVAYVYMYTSSAINAGNLTDAADAGYAEYDYTDTEATDFPLFTITAAGRGFSNLSFRIVPEYSSSKSSTFIKYSVEVWEASEVIESIMFTMNPEIIIDDISQAIQPKINDNSRQIQCKMFEDGIYGLVRCLCQYATVNGENVPISTMSNMDFINGYERRGNVALGNVITAATVANSEDQNIQDQYEANQPADIETPYNLADKAGIPLVNGSYGDTGTAPINNTAEYEQLMLGAWGKDTDSEQYDPIIFDLDAYKPDAVFDCGFPVSVKNAIIDVLDFRGDMVFLADLGTQYNDLNSILNAAMDINASRYCAVYHNYFNIVDPYTKKDITVTMPLLLAKKLVAHVSKGIGRPFAGLANNIYFPEILPNTVNFLPVNVPGEDQKQKLADASINYISYYDGTPVMETMYTNNDEYTQLSYLHNILAIQEVIKAIRSRCPRTRYTFLDGDDLEEYLTDAEAIIRQYSTNFRSITIQYMADEKYEANNIFYATIVVQFRNFVQEEYFKIIAIS